MNPITSVSVQHIRAHDQYTFTLSPSVTLITGVNGSGKTSLIEALYIALQGSSFKGSDNDVLRRNAPWYRIDVTFKDNSRRTVKFDPSKTSGKKQFIINEKTHYRLSHSVKYPVVLFEPDDLRLLQGSPTRRRQFIDRFISQLDPEYALSLRRYERTLKQRNSLLKQPSVPKDNLFAWDVSLSEYGAYIIQKRLEVTEHLNQRVNEAYNNIAHTDDTVAIRYSERPHAQIKQWLLAHLHAAAERDILLGYTSVGPHRHDLLFDFNGSPALTVASRGETRSIVLALKFLEVEYITEHTNQRPIILLDDVFSELDPQRQQYLVMATDRYQIIITSANADKSLHANARVRL